MMNLIKAYICIVSLLSGFVHAEDIVLLLAIDNVTVHPASAIVTRKAKISIPAGDHRLIIDSLPADLDIARLQLSINHPSVRFGSIDVVNVDQQDSLREQIVGKEQAIIELNEKRQESSDVVSVAQSQLQLLSTLVNAKADTDTWVNLKAGDLDALLQSVGSNSNLALLASRQAKIQQRQLDQEIAKLRQEIVQLKEQKLESTRVYVNIAAQADIDTEAILSYPIAEAGWQWLYEARLDTKAKALSLVRQVAVSQSSSDSWDNVEIAVTTTNLKQSTTTPDLNSVFVQWWEENGSGRHEISRRRAFQSIAQAQKPNLGNTQAGEVIEEVIVTGSYLKGSRSERATNYRDLESIAHDPYQTKKPAEIVSSQYLVDFKIPGRVSVSNNSQEKLLTIGESFFDVELATRVVPAVELNAFLEARFVYSDGIPFPAAQIHLYRDGGYIGDGFVETFLPGEEVQLAFGIDELVRVEQIAEEESSAIAGAFGRSSLIQTRLRYDLHSFHDQPLNVEVIGRIPVSQDKRLSIDIPDTATPADESDFRGISGINLWKLTLPPREKASIYHHVDIHYPKDSMLSFTNKQ